MGFVFPLVGRYWCSLWVAVVPVVVLLLLVVFVLVALLVLVGVLVMGFALWSHQNVGVQLMFGAGGGCMGGVLGGAGLGAKRILSISGMGSNVVSLLSSSMRITVPFRIEARALKMMPPYVSLPERSAFSMIRIDGVKPSIQLFGWRRKFRATVQATNLSL